MPSHAVNQPLANIRANENIMVDFERVVTMILNTSYLTFLVLLYSSTSRYPNPAIRSTPCEVHPGAGGTF